MSLNTRVCELTVGTRRYRPNRSVLATRTNGYWRTVLFRYRPEEAYMRIGTEVGVAAGGGVSSAA